MILSHLDMERRYEIILTDQPWKQTKWVRDCRPKQNRNPRIKLWGCRTLKHIRQ